MLASRKVRAPQGRVVGNAHREQSQGKCHRKHTADGVGFGRRTGKGEKVRGLRALNVRAHRAGGDTGGKVNPTRRKTK